MSPAQSAVSVASMMSIDGGKDEGLAQMWAMINKMRHRNTDQVVFPRNQRKDRKNRRRAHAAGKKNVFKK